MTKEEFIKTYQINSKLSNEQMNNFLKTQDVIKCDCGEQNCKGWQMKSKSLIPNGQTFTQEQLNTVAQCYQDEITRLLQVKVNKDLIILRLQQSNAEKDKQIAELNKVKEKIKSNKK